MHFVEKMLLCNREVRYGIKFIPYRGWPDPDPDQKLFIPDPDPDPDPAKSSGSDRIRIRIHNTGWKAVLQYLEQDEQLHEAACTAGMLYYST